MDMYQPIRTNLGTLPLAILEDCADDVMRAAFAGIRPHDEVYGGTSWPTAYFYDGVLYQYGLDAAGEKLAWRKYKLTEIK
jgi:hypothetical protein